MTSTVDTDAITTTMKYKQHIDETLRYGWSCVGCVKLKHGFNSCVASPTMEAGARYYFDPRCHRPGVHLTRVNVTPSISLIGLDGVTMMRVSRWCRRPKLLVN